MGTQFQNELGRIKNYLGILSADKKSVRPDVLRGVTGLGATELARQTSFTRQQLYEEKLPLKLSDKLMRRIIHLVIATDEAFELLNHNHQETALWLMEPNAAFFGATPFEVCLRGDGEELIKWLRTRSGKMAGTGF
ncbi:MAG: hypothetical protein N2578_00665 [Bdellovibrionaceae bacterium]|nr:hypothetical protein [Pseudobdellovibrionaceae bacterium]